MALPAVVAWTLIGAALGLTKAGAQKFYNARKKKKAVKDLLATLERGEEPTVEQLNLAEGKPANGIREASFFHGTPGQTETVSTQTPEQQKIQKESLNRLSESLPNFQLPGQQLTPEQQQQQQQQLDKSFKPYEDSALKNFHQNVVPTLATRFTGLTNGRLGSGSFTSQLGRAGGALAQDLASQKATYGLNQQNAQSNNFAQLLSGGLSRGVENIYHPGENAGYQNLINSLAPGAGNALGSYLGNKK